jgi:hypothetical protein
MALLLRELFGIPIILKPIKARYSKTAKKHDNLEQML